MTTIHTGYSDGDVDTNRTDNVSLESLVAERYSRRQTMMGGLSATALAFLGTSLLTGCNDSDEANAAPLVSAGASGTASSGRIVTLTGTATDTDGILSSSWIQIAGPTVTLEPVSTTSVRFMAPSVAASTEFRFRYTAADLRGAVSAAETTITVAPAVLGFASIAKNRNDVVTVPAGYTVTVLTRLGDPIAAGIPAFANNGTDTNFAQRIGDHGDALYWYGLNAAGGRDDFGSTRGLMVQNHENLNVQYLHPNGPTAVTTGPRPEGEALKEIEAHGVSVVEYRGGGNRA